MNSKLAIQKETNKLALAICIDETFHIFYLLILLSPAVPRYTLSEPHFALRTKAAAAATKPSKA